MVTDCIVYLAEYTAVPLPHEIEASGNFLPHIAPNAEEMINWALSHVPKRDGPRRSNDKKRSQARMAFMKSEAAKKKKEMSAAALRKQVSILFPPLSRWALPCV